MFIITDHYGYTRGGLPGERLWSRGTTHIAKKGKPKFGTQTIIPVYLTPLLAILLCPIYEGISDPTLWAVRGDILIDNGLLLGCKSVTAIEQISAPQCFCETRVKFAILCAKEVYYDSASAWNCWADNWLNKSNRSASLARAVALSVPFDSAASRCAKAASWTAELYASKIENAHIDVGDLAAFTALMAKDSKKISASVFAAIAEKALQ